MSDETVTRALACSRPHAQTWRPRCLISRCLHYISKYSYMYDDEWRGWNIHVSALNDTPAPLCLSDLVSVFVCALHVVSPRDLWWCVLPRWQLFVFENVNVSSFFDFFHATPPVLTPARASSALATGHDGRRRC